MHRIECNLSTGEIVHIQQKVYKDNNDNTIVIDADKPAPEGFIEVISNT